MSIFRQTAHEAHFVTDQQIKTTEISSLLIFLLKAFILLADQSSTGSTWQNWISKDRDFISSKWSLNSGQCLCWFIDFFETATALKMVIYQVIFNSYGDMYTLILIWLCFPFRFGAVKIGQINNREYGGLMIWFIGRFLSRIQFAFINCLTIRLVE